jgi:hypothetical protein
MFEASKRWPGNAFSACKSNDWAFAVLGSLAPIARLIQCLKRYWDTRVPIHLVNALKYSISGVYARHALAGVVDYLCVD